MMNRLHTLLASLGGLRTGGSMLRRRRMVPILLLGLALVSVQTLGLLHRVVHAPALSAALQGDVGGLQAPDRVTARVAEGSAAATDFLAQLFASHQTGSDCRSYDQLSHGDSAAGVSAQVLPLVLPVLRPFVVAVDTLVRRPALVQARGPPMVS
jgi:hypothetical protein